MAGRRGLGGNRARDLARLRPRPVMQRRSVAPPDATDAGRLGAGSDCVSTRLTGREATEPVTSCGGVFSTEPMRAEFAQPAAATAISEKMAMRENKGEQNGTSRRDMWLLTHTLQT